MCQNVYIQVNASFFKVDSLGYKNAANIKHFIPHLYNCL